MKVRYNLDVEIEVDADDEESAIEKADKYLDDLSISILSYNDVECQ